MIDIHSHILPGVDDGSDSLDLSLKMLMEAKRQGISDIIVTCHYDHDGLFNLPREVLGPKLVELRRAAADLGIRLHSGNEIYISKDILSDLKRKRIFTLARSYYLLVEFPFGEYSDEYDFILYELKRFGFRIIIAHPERYRYVSRDNSFVKRWTSEGYYLQCNASSIERHTDTIRYLLDNDLVSFFASDAHNLNRNFALKPAYDWLSANYGSERAEKLLTINPSYIISNKALG